MSRRVKEYVLSSRFYTRLLGSYGEVICYTCGKELHLDEEVVSVATCYGGRILRHRACAEKINLI